MIVAVDPEFHSRSIKAQQRRFVRWREVSMNTLALKSLKGATRRSKP
jgi:hypothetical protein